MDPERWRRVERILDEALELDAEQRTAFLDEACAGDASLRDEIESLLAADRAASGFLDERAVEPPQGEVTELGRTQVEGGRFEGRYELRQKIGEGGMGEVYLAEQLGPVRRRVALKLIKIGMDTRSVVARFESERQALAMMNHLNIARVYDAGATRRGRPFFAMEYVQGVPITEHCDVHRLSTRERLELLEQVCHGVQHAHQKAVIHRDIKPSNVLVTIEEERAVPKIIDFGVAKATAMRLTEKTVFTELGQVVGTPEYMSPEQAEMTGQDIDTRTDVYSLGVLMYQLLVGTLPFDRQDVREVGLDEFRRRIREDEPPRPSTRITTRADHAAGIAAAHRTDPGTLSRELRGDLDWITMKALEKDRTRRFGSPAELAADIRRYLDGQPVVARPPSTSYRAAKFVRRHRFGVVMACIITLALAGGLVGTGIGLRHAQQEARRAQAFRDFVTRMLLSVDPAQAQGEEVTVRQILDNVSVDDSYADTPLVEADLRALVGTMYYTLGLSGRAEPELRRATALHRDLFGEEHAHTLKIANQLAMNYFQQQRLPEAEEEWERQLAIRRRLFGEEHPETVTMMHNLGAVLLRKGRFDRAEELLESALVERRRLLGDEHVSTTATLSNLAQLYVETDRYGEAIPLYVEALEARRGELGNSHPRTLNSLYNLGDAYARAGRYRDALPMLEEAVVGFRKVLGNEHPNTLVGLTSLARTLLRLERPDEAEQLALEAHRGELARHGASHGNTLDLVSLLTEIYENTGRPNDARTWRQKLPDPLEPAR